MADGVYRRNIEGTCEIRLIDGQDSHSSFIGYYNHELSYSEGTGSDPDAAVKMKAETLSSILAGPDKFDLRDPDVLLQVSAEGNLELANFLFALIKRPSKDIEQKIRKAEADLSGAPRRTGEVKRVYRPSEEEILRLLEESVPFVITGAIDDWALLSKSLPEIKKEYGDVALRPSLDEKKKEKFETLGDFIDTIDKDTSGKVYTYGCPLPLAIWAEMPLPFFDWESLTTPQIWMGKKTGERPCTTLHRDCTHGFLAHQMGRKKMIFFSPDQSDFLYPLKAFNMFQPCEVNDVQHVDLERFPLFRNAEPMEVVVEPGEILVIPAFWFHCVYALDDVISISFGLLWSSWERLRSR
jgi:hypothetical protein